MDVFERISFLISELRSEWLYHLSNLGIILFAACLAAYVSGKKLNLSGDQLYFNQEKISKNFTILVLIYIVYVLMRHFDKI